MAAATVCTITKFTARSPERDANSVSFRLRIGLVRVCGKQVVARSQMAPEWQEAH